MRSGRENSVEAVTDLIIRIPGGTVVTTKSKDAPIQEKPVNPTFQAPYGREEMNKMLGDPLPEQKFIGKKYAYSKKWARNYGRLLKKGEIPAYRHRPLWVNKAVVDPFLCAMLLLEGAGFEYKKIGCFNPRPKRYNAALGPSVHTWAAAFDIDAKENPSFIPNLDSPTPFSPGWKQRSKLTEEEVNIFEKYGFEWGGRWSKFRDPMHFQFARGY